MKVYEKELTDAEYEKKLNEIYGPVQICGMVFDSGWVFKQLDPIAFRVGMDDEPIYYCCGKCDTEYPDDKGAAEKCCKRYV